MVYYRRIRDLQTSLNGRLLLTEYAKDNSELCAVRLKNREQVYNLTCDRAATARRLVNNFCDPQTPQRLSGLKIMLGSMSRELLRGSSRSGAGKCVMETAV
jgi:hypothetical protein